MVVHHSATGAQCYIGGARWSCTIVHRVQHAILLLHNGHAASCTGCTMLYWGGRIARCARALHKRPLVVHDVRVPSCTGCTMLFPWCTMALYHRALGARCYICGARWSCTIVHRVHDPILVVQDRCAPSCSGCTMLYWWFTMAVQHRAPGARCYICGARWSCTILHRVHNALGVVPDSRVTSCTGCTMLYWPCRIGVHHHAPGAHCYIGGARWSCTIVHRVHIAILVVHDGPAPSCTGCTMLHWWCTMVMHHRAPGAHGYIGVARWSFTIVHRVHNTILMVKYGRAPWCSGCTMLYWWCTMDRCHRVPGAQCYVGGARWSCTIVQRVHMAILVLHNGRAPSCTVCAMLY